MASNKASNASPTAPKVQLVISYSDPVLGNRSILDEIHEFQGYIEKCMDNGMSPNIELTVNGAPLVKV